MEKSISKTTLKRLPIYLQYLKSLDPGLDDHISATNIARALSLGEVQVRKDLGSVSGQGKPKIGYHMLELIDLLESFLGFKDASDAVVIGCGRLGSAILSYEGFEEYGIRLVAGFDLGDEIRMENGRKIFPMSKVNDLVKRMGIRMVILCVPDHAAQEITDGLVESGVRAIMNFAPVHLNVPADVQVQNINLATMFAMLASTMQL